MNLKEFVSESLKDIFDGIEEAQSKVKDAKNKAGINPKNLTHCGDKPHSYLWDHETNTAPQVIDFDIAVTITEDKKTSGKAGISVWSIGVGVDKKTDSLSSTVSRIKFSMPVVFPPQSRK